MHSARFLRQADIVLIRDETKQAIFTTSTESQTAPAQVAPNAACTICAPEAAALATFQRAIRAISGKWKLRILFRLTDGPVRFGRLRRAIAGVTQHVRTAQLREREHDRLVLRTAFGDVPLRVEYAPTDATYGVLPAFRALLARSEQHGRPA